MPSPEPTPADLLRSAARSIETALILLNMNHRQCADCGSTHHENQTHYKVYTQLSDTPRKLTEAASRLENESSMRRLGVFEGADHATHSPR